MKNMCMEIVQDKEVRLILDTQLKVGEGDKECN